VLKCFSMDKTSLNQKILLIIFGITLSFILIEVSLRLGGGFFLYLQDISNKKSFDRGRSYKIMCIGESTTALGGKAAYPLQLENILNERGEGLKFTVINKGVPAVNTSFILKNLEKNLDKYNPDMVVAMMGVNDVNIQYNRKKASKQTFPSKLKSFRVFKLIKHITNSFLKMSTSFNDEFNDFDFKSVDKQKAFNQDQKSEIAELTNKIIKNFDDYDAYFRLGTLYFDSGYYTMAEDCFKNSIKFNSINYWSHIGLGCIYINQGKSSQLNSVIIEALKIRPNDPLVYFELGGYAYKVGSINIAKELYKKVIALNKSSEIAYINLGLIYYEQGLCWEAVNMFEKAIELNPNNGQIFMELGFAYLDLHEFDKSKSILSRALKLSLNSADTLRVYSGMSIKHKFSEDFDKAIIALEKSLSLEENNLDISFELAVVYRYAGNHDKAKELLKIVMLGNPDNYKVYFELGLIYLDQNKRLESKEMFEKFLDYIRENPSQLSSDALMYTSLENIIDGLKKESSWDQDYEQKYIGLGLCCRYQEDVPGTINMFKKALEINPNNFQANFELGMTYLCIFEYEKALYYFIKSNKIEPTNKRPYFEIALIHKRQGGITQAISVIEDALDLWPEDKRLNLVLGFYHRDDGNIKLANHYFLKAENLKNSIYGTETRYNFNKLKTIISKRGLSLVCVQYPVRSYLPLMDLFDDTDDIIFVDNEGVFKDTLKKGKYEDYFKDAFGGDFGHCTFLGNKLLVENVAKVILGNF